MCFDSFLIDFSPRGFDKRNLNRPGLQALKVTGIVRAYPIIYYNQHARNAMISYMKTLPSVTLWIGKILKNCDGA